MVEFMMQGIRDRKSMTRWFYSFIFGMSLLGTLLTPAQGSVLTVQQTTSAVTSSFYLGVQCRINGWFKVGDMCLADFHVPQGWQLTVIDDGVGGSADCDSASQKSERPPVGKTFREGEYIRIKTISKITSMWTNSGTARCYAYFSGRVISPAGENSTLVGTSAHSGGFLATKLFYGIDYIYTGAEWTSINIPFTSRTKLNKLTMDVADSIALRQGETARLFTVRNSTIGDGRVQVTLSGDAAGSLTTYKNGSVANCDNKVFGADEYCEIRVASNVPWFGERKARANVTVTIN